MWTWLTSFLLVGYLAMGRAFAYVGIPPLRLFIGDMVLAAFLFPRPGNPLNRLIPTLLKRKPLDSLAWAYLLFLGYGLFQVVRGLGTGHPAFETVRNLVFNAYPLYLLLGISVGLTNPDLLHKCIRFLAWFNGIYGIAYILYLSQLRWLFPGAERVPLFGQPAASAVVLVGLLYFERNLWKVWPQLLMNAFVLLGVLVRADWLATALGVSLCGILAGRARKALATAGCVLLLLLVGYLADFRIPSPSFRGGSISSQEIAIRAFAIIDAETAAQYAESPGRVSGTLYWRQDWWKAIWEAVTDARSDQVFYFGLGYGYPLASLVSHVPPNVITPHNVFMYALGYTGWVGVAVFALFQYALASCLWAVRRTTGDSFGFIYWAMAMAFALFGNLLETPFGAIPLYLVAGISLAPLLKHEHPADSQLLPATGRRGSGLPVRS